MTFVICEHLTDNKFLSHSKYDYLHRMYGRVGTVESGRVRSCQVRSAAMKSQQKKTFGELNGTYNRQTDIAEARLSWPMGRFSENIMSFF